MASIVWDSILTSISTVTFKVEAKFLCRVQWFILFLFGIWIFALLLDQRCALKRNHTMQQSTIYAATRALGKTRRTIYVRILAVLLIAISAPLVLLVEPALQAISRDLIIYAIHPA